MRNRLGITALNVLCCRLNNLDDSSSGACFRRQTKYLSNYTSNTVSVFVQQICLVFGEMLTFNLSSFWGNVDVKFF